MRCIRDRANLGRAAWNDRPGEARPYNPAPWLSPPPNPMRTASKGPRTPKIAFLKSLIWGAPCSAAGRGEHPPLLQGPPPPSYLPTPALPALAGRSAHRSSPHCLVFSISEMRGDRAPPQPRPHPFQPPAPVPRSPYPTPDTPACPCATQVVARLIRAGGRSEASRGGVSHCSRVGGRVRAPPNTLWLPCVAPSMTPVKAGMGAAVCRS